MSEHPPRIMVVLPTYNEKENLEAIVAALFALPLPQLEILIVDDNSPDGTGQIAERLRGDYDERVQVLHRQQKAGLGPAYIAGFQEAIRLGAAVIIQMDADFSHQPHYIPLMLEKLQNADVVAGSRFVKGGSVDETWSPYRKLLSWWANRIYTPTLLRLPVYDSTGGYRMWRRETLIGMDLSRIHSNGYVFQVEMIYVAYKLGYRVVEYPIHFPDRRAGKSKMSTRVALEAAIRVWEILARYWRFNPTRRAHD